MNEICIIVTLLLWFALYFAAVWDVWLGEKQWSVSSTSGFISCTGRSFISQSPSLGKLYCPFFTLTGSYFQRCFPAFCHLVYVGEVISVESTLSSKQACWKVRVSRMKREAERCLCLTSRQDFCFHFKSGRFSSTRALTFSTSSHSLHHTPPSKPLLQKTQIVNLGIIKMKVRMLA